MANKDTDTLSVRISKVAKAWIQGITRERGLTMTDLFNDLYESVNSGTIVYENRVFHGEEEYERPRLEMRIAELMTEVNLQKAKIRGLEEQLGENEENFTKREPKNFSEKEKEPIKDEQPTTNNIPNEEIDVRMLYELAKKHRITPQSLLDMALRPYR